jgi:threonine efflux protein
MTTENVSFLTILSVYLLGLISPGPDFALVLRNSLAKRSGKAWATALGIATGVAVHLMLITGVLRVGGEISSTFTRAVALVGGIYLGYLGAQTVLSEFRSGTTHPQGSEPAPPVIAKSNWEQFRQGLWTNLFNPKVAAFFWSLLASALRLGGPWELTLKIIMVLMTLFWFWWLGLALRHSSIQTGLQKIRRPISTLMGLLLLFYSVTLLLGF